MLKKTEAEVKPLVARSGAHYTCFGDGLCCTDLHGLGPLTKKEVVALRLVSRDVVEPPSEEGFDEPMLRTRSDGGCLFLGPDRCHLHAALGADAKPVGCRRFPLGLAATPMGGRVTTRHRCPCRTLGARPLLAADDAAPSLRDKKGRLSPDRVIGDTVRLTVRKKISFEEWTTLETDILMRLATGVAPETVLDAKPFPKLRRSSWKRESSEMMEDGVDGTRFGSALSWFAQAIRGLTGLRRQPISDLVWSEAFDRAEARSPEPGDPALVVADWIADEIWGLEWADGGHFALARADLSTRLAICQDIRSRLEKRGRRPDRAAAEAVAVVDLVGDSEWWSDITAKMNV
jgi:Fe-S-cluster containining protein